MFKQTETSRSYRYYVDGDWRLWIFPPHWNLQLWGLVQARINELNASRHPATIQIRIPAAQGEQVGFLKVFYPFSSSGSFKDFFRDSKALRAFKQGLALKAIGFNVPLTVAAGEERKRGVLGRSFLLTWGIRGEPLPVFLHRLCVSETENFSVREKRDAARKLATELRRFHALGFVHGDLVPSNILVSTAPVDGTTFYLLDHDRTRRYPSWLPQLLWRRNLVQLNRFPLPGISLQDRMRFLKHYLARNRWQPEDRQLISWLENKTLTRRWECDRVKGAKTFRELMRWNGPFAGDPAPHSKQQ